MTELAVSPGPSASRTRGGGRRRRVRRILGLVTVSALAIAVAAAPFSTITFVSLPLVALAIVLVPPLADKNYQLVSPWSFVILSVVLGVTARGLYIAFQYPDPRLIQRLFLLGESTEYFFWPTLVLVLGLVAMTVGYCARQRLRHFRPPLFVRTAVWDERRMWLVVALLATVSVIAGWEFIMRHGGFTPALLSAKRGLPGVELVQGFESHRHLAIMHDAFGLAAALIPFAYVLFSRSRLRPGTMGIIAVLFLNAMALQFYISSRGGLVWTVLYGLGVLVLSPRRVRWGALALVLITGLFMVQVMTVLRPTRQQSVDLAIEAIDPASVIQPLVLNRNMLGIDKTAHIVNAVPDKLNYRYGGTVLNSMAAPIPRALWPGKPIIGNGKTIGAEIYGETRSGVPPGFIAEAYWNLHIVGVLIGGLLVGRFLRWLANGTRRWTLHRNGALIYVISVMPLGFFIVGSEFMIAFIDPAMNAVVMSVSLIFITSSWRSWGQRRGRSRRGIERSDGILGAASGNAAR